MRSPAVRVTLSTLFQAVQGTLGVSVTPSHFYFPVPDLKSFRGKDWIACRPCRGIDFRFAEQLDRLHRELMPFIRECDFPEAPNGHEDAFHFNNGFFERVDAEVAYAFVRSRKPRRIIEIGSGNTTLVLTAALRANREEGHPGELTSIEPHPAGYLRHGLDGMTRLIDKPVQQVGLDCFEDLEENDILFIDSSHVVSVDSDVLFECLRILPDLRRGVLIHFHDIFTPLDYPEKFVMKNLCFWGEQYMLEAFLAFNRVFRVLWSASAVQRFYWKELDAAFPLWNGSFTRMPADLQTYAPRSMGKMCGRAASGLRRASDLPHSRAAS
jgi:predicted O-methyltransferase YrrM